MDAQIDLSLRLAHMFEGACSDVAFKMDLTLKMPRKPASENGVCLCHLLNILANFSNLFLRIGKHVDPDQTVRAV